MVQVSSTALMINVKNTVESILNSCQDRLELVKYENRVVPFSELLKDSMIIQQICHAPREYKVGLALLNGHPPAPQPQQMRMGLLTKFQSIRTEQADKLQNVDNIEQPKVFVSDLSVRLNRQRKRDRLSLQINEDLTEKSQSDTVQHIHATVDSQQDNEIMPVRYNESKKVRMVNISFASYDSDEGED